jgi:hypothetical protein
VYDATTLNAQRMQAMTKSVPTKRLQAVTKSNSPALHALSKWGKP